jgi:hypothetical protein
LTAPSNEVRLERLINAKEEPSAKETGFPQFGV